MAKDASSVSQQQRPTGESKAALQTVIKRSGSIGSEWDIRDTSRPLPRSQLVGSETHHVNLEPGHWAWHSMAKDASSVSQQQRPTGESKAALHFVNISICLTRFTNHVVCHGNRRLGPISSSESQLVLHSHCIRITSRFLSCTSTKQFCRVFRNPR